MARSFKTHAHCSLSLSALVDSSPGGERVTPRRMSASLSLASAPDDSPDELVRVVIEPKSAQRLREAIPSLAEGEEIVPLASGSYAATLTLPRLRELILQADDGLRIDSKKRAKPRLDHVAKDVRLLKGSPEKRQVQETGEGVLVGIVDSGFDLTHPAFYSAAGKLRVEKLLTQRETPRGQDKVFTTAELDQHLANGANPAADTDGHGTHVATIAAGTIHRNFEGIAPEARFLLVKTNFIDTDKAVSWIFTQARDMPCVVNLSLGHHWGAHDGSDPEERLYDKLAAPGKIIVVAAGNERLDLIHIGGRFATDETQTVMFDVLRPEDDSKPEAVLVLWHEVSDKFSFTLISPAGQEFKVPSSNRGLEESASGATIKLMRGRFRPNGLVQVQIQILFRAARPPLKRLRKWRLRCNCQSAVVGRLDGWFSNSGFAEFRPHPLVETARTIGLPATSKSCIAVACHVSKVKWNSDQGDQNDADAVIGRSSDFSSLGPTRDGRNKPEISAPGQYVTAALAKDSELQDEDDRSVEVDRLATIEGTSMSAPAVTGVIALMLQKKSNITVAQIQSILAVTARRDSHTGHGNWTPKYGFGKIDVVEAISRV